MLNDTSEGRLHCPTCGAVISGENINVQQLVAVCTACDTVFSFEEIVAAKDKRRKYKQPDNMTLDDTGPDLRLTYPQKIGREDRQGLAVSVFIASLTGFIGTMMLTADDAPKVLAVLMLAFALVFFTTMLAVLFNRKQITVTPDEFHVKQRPVPIPIPGEDWLFGEKRLIAQDVTRVYCEETEDSRKSGGMQRYYHVCLGLADGGRVFLVKGLPQAHAFYIMQQVQAYLADASTRAAQAAADEALTDATLALADDADADAGDSDDSDWLIEGETQYDLEV
jgi:hypothetical protein